MSDVDFKVGADASAANASLDKLQDKAAATGNKMNSAFREASYKMAGGFKDMGDKVNSEFGRMQESARKAQVVMLALSASVGAFGLGIKRTIDLADHMNDLSKKTGLAVEQLSAWRLVVDQSGTDMETLAVGIKSASKYLVEHGNNLEKIGIHATTAEEVILQLAGVLEKLPADDPRRVALAVEVLDKNAMSLLPALSEGEAGLRKMLERGKELSTINKEMAENADKFNDKLSELKTLSGQVFINISKNLLPALNELAQKFLDAQKAVEGFWGAWAAFTTKDSNYEAKLAETQSRLRELKRLRAELDPNKSAANKVNEFIFGDSNTLDKQIAAAEQEERTLRRLVEIREKRLKVESAPTASTGNVDTSSIDKILNTGGAQKDKKPESRTGQWDAELAAMRDAFERQKLEQGSFEEFGKARERDYWKHILDTVKLRTEERRQVSGKYYAIERDLRKAAFDSEIADLRSQQNAYQEGSVDRIRIAGETAIKIGEKYGIQSKEYKAALDDMRQMAVAHEKQQEQLAGLELERTRAHQQGLLELERVRLEESSAMGEITESQKLQALAKLKEEEFQIELKAAQERAALLEGDVVAYQQAMDKILEIKQKHELDQAKIEKDIKVADEKQFNDMFSPIEKAFEKSITGMIQGTQTMRQAMRGMMQSILAEFANMGVKMVVQWIASQARITMATATGTATRTGIETAGAAKSMALSGQTSLKTIMNGAYEAMAGAYKAIAGIPVVGPFLAPVVAAGAFAAVAGLAGSVMSAEGGYDIPAGINPITQLHQNEMVLPAEYASPLRDQLKGGGSAGGVTVNISAVDARGVKELFRNNPEILTPAMRRAKRNYSPTSTIMSPLGRVR